MNSASSSSAGVTSSDSHATEIANLKAERDLVKAKRELVENLLKVEEVERPGFIYDNQDYTGLISFNTQELKEEKQSLYKEISDLSAEILSLRTFSSGKYPHCHCHVSLYFNSYTCLFLIAWTFSFILSNHSYILVQLSWHFPSICFQFAYIYCFFSSFPFISQ